MATSWETFQHEPWNAVNEEYQKQGSYAGWNTLLITVTENEVKYHIGNNTFVTHGNAVVPESPMSINFNLWFSSYSQESVELGRMREYQQDIDWVLHVPNKILSFKEVESVVNKMREQNVTYTDTVIPARSVLESPCGL
jgi:hypothetical protein